MNGIGNDCGSGLILVPMCTEAVCVEGWAADYLILEIFFFVAVKTADIPHRRSICDTGGHSNGV